VEIRERPALKLALTQLDSTNKPGR
jgi:hypothetical protein